VRPRICSNVTANENAKEKAEDRYSNLIFSSILAFRYFQGTARQTPFKRTLVLISFSVCAVCRVPCAVCRVPCAVCRVPCAVCRDDSRG
jgi:hypothetical protein